MSLDKIPSIFIYQRHPRVTINGHLDNLSFSLQKTENFSLFSGIEAGSTIGLYLDLDQCLLSFYCNDEKHGPIEFPSLEDVDVVYPAFSLNRNVTMTLYSGIKPPTEM